MEDFFQFSITRKIAEGGMGAVYEAKQIGAGGFEKTVAIKTMLEKLSGKGFSEMFIAEAKLAANLVHENIVQIYQLGRMPGGYYIVMEYVNGISLSNFIAYHKIMRTRMPEALAVFIAGRVARGLAYAHKRSDPSGRPLGIVHRDVCPGNILITTEGLPKLADFGVAKAAKSALMDDGQLVGTLRCMAPEQAWQKRVDRRADIFSLGAVLFEMLSLYPIREVDGKRHARELAEQKVPWDRLASSIPRNLRGILRKMLRPEPKCRYQDADLLADALERHSCSLTGRPTTRMLERYMRHHFGFLYDLNRREAAAGGKEDPTVIPFPGFFKRPKTEREQTRKAREYE